MNSNDSIPDSHGSPTHLSNEHAAPGATIHELRNFLAPISNAANLLRLKSSTDESLLPLSVLIEKNVKMIGQILERFNTSTVPPSIPTNYPDSSNAHKRVLIADDNEAFRSTLQKILTTIGYEVKGAADGEEAIKIIAVWKPDCVLLDAHMPKLNGYAVAKKLRNEFPTGTMSIVLLSGDNLDAHIVNSAKLSGFDHCLDKIDDTGLQQLLSSGA